MDVRKLFIASQLSREQLACVNVVKAGHNVFFTGCAGTGKTFLLKYIIDHVVPKRTTFVTALTGVAALALGGTTLHSFAGIGLGNQPAVQMAATVNRSRQKRNWKEAQILIIDEISMLDAALFEKLDYVGMTTSISIY